jgi:hypothetical protein
MISESSIARADVAGLPQDRLDARVLAHALIEQSQVTPRPKLLGRLAEVPGFTRRALVVNRLENALSLACALLEIGQRESACRVAANSLRPAPAERDDLPPIWAVEVLALEHFLDAIVENPRFGSGGVPREVPARLYGQLATSTWTGYRACLLLATALGAHDLGDVATAPRLAEHALTLLDDHMPSITTLAMHLAAQGTQDEATWRYARHLAGLRWQTRLAVLDAVRSRVAAARVLRQGEQLNRKA